MGVHGTWLFLKGKGIHGTRVNNAKYIHCLLDNANDEDIVHVDVVSAFYNVIRDNFVCQKSDDMLSAANKIMDYASLVVDKSSCILYFDGNPTVERTFANTNSTSQKLETQNNLEIIIPAYLKSPSHQQYQTIMQDIAKLFFVTTEIKSILRHAALGQGWKVSTAIGEAEVDIGIRGGIVLSNDSDMFYYPKVQVLIKPDVPGVFEVYQKSAILKKLGLTSEAFTTLGIIPTNDYDKFQYPYPILKNDGNNYSRILHETFSTVKLIQSALLKNPYIHNIIPVHPTVKDYLECYISFMNDKYNINHSTKTISMYQNSYNIFVLQRQQILPKACDFREVVIKRPSYFFYKIHANHV